MLFFLVLSLSLVKNYKVIHQHSHLLSLLRLVLMWKIYAPFVNLLFSSGQSSYSGVLQDCVHAFVHRHLGDACSHQACSQDGKSPGCKRETQRSRYSKKQHTHTHSVCGKVSHTYLTSLSGVPNRFFLHATWPWYRPIRAADSVVLAKWPKFCNRHGDWWYIMTHFTTEILKGYASQ